ncbi:MAG: gliding motility-associated protein GldE [Crocinitomicaceae bacterium]|jgi:gliding motility-associated protein GldE|nr:gliding motility-associated protein GldE [Crocinitomicaceae bacterium]
MEDSIPVTNIDPLVTTLQSGFSTEVIIGLIVIAVLLVCSALISGSEAAFFSLSPSEKDSLKSSDNKKGQTAQKLLDKPQDLLATILITNNFVNVAVVILCSSVLQEIYPPAPGNETIRLIIEVFLITLILLLAGEVIPKIYATQNSMRFAMFMSSTLNGLGNIPPISWIKKFLVNGSNIIQKNARKKGIKISSTELEQALALTKEENTSHVEHRILEGIVKFGNTEVCQIMRSRVDVIALDHELDFKQVMEIILHSGYSRIPVYKDSFDNVIGILFIKDILPFLDEQDNEKFDWLKLTRKPFFVPENKKIDDLLKEFQGKKVHMAVIVDEYGGASGICTLEDVLEEIVGDITDEFDDDEIVFTKIDDNNFLFEGKTALVDVYKVLETDGKEFDSNKGDAETIGGFIVENAGRILKNNEYIEVGNYRLVVESSDKRRVKMVKIVNQLKAE